MNLSDFYTNSNVINIFVLIGQCIPDKSFAFNFRLRPAALGQSDALLYAVFVLYNETGEPKMNTLDKKYTIST